MGDTVTTAYSKSISWPEEQRTITPDYAAMKHNYFPSTCDHCPNNPKNGGYGICFCIIGTPKITC
jgi:hypothetical protein